MNFKQDSTMRDLGLTLKKAILDYENATGDVVLVVKWGISCDAKTGFYYDKNERDISVEVKNLERYEEIE